VLHKYTGSTGDPETFGPNIVQYFPLKLFKQCIIIIIIIIILGIFFMQGIYTYIPETNHAPRESCVATILM
jgi:hypothetical protein